MSRKERIITWIAWHLPRSVAYWAYVRVATAGDEPGVPYGLNPVDQRVDEPLKRWAAR